MIIWRLAWMCFQASIMVAAIGLTAVKFFPAEIRMSPYKTLPLFS